MHRPLARERGPVGNDQLLAAAARKRRVAADIADLGLVHVLAGEDGDDAGPALGLLDGDRADAGEGVRRADEMRIGLASHRRVGRESAGAAHQSVVLDPRSMGRAAFGGR